MSGKFTFQAQKTPEIGGIKAVSLPFIVPQRQLWVLLELVQHVQQRQSQ